MVETVSASTLPQGTGNGSAARQLEPGTELKARVEGNLPGGVVRLATAEGKVDLRVATPLPTNAEVTVTVSGSKQQPVIQITTDKVPAQSGSQSGAPVQGQGGQPSRASPPQANTTQTYTPQVTPSQTGQPQAAAAPQPGAAGPVITAPPSGAHLVQVLSASAGPESAATAARQAAPSTGAPPAQGPGAPPSPLPGPTVLPAASRPAQTTVTGNAVSAQTGAQPAALNGAAPAGAFQPSAGAPSSLPSATPAVAPSAGGNAAAALPAQAGIAGAQPAVSPNLQAPGGQQAVPPQAGNFPAGPLPGAGTAALSSTAAALPGAAGTQAGVSALAATAPGTQSAAGSTPGTTPQPGSTPQAISPGTGQGSAVTGQIGTSLSAGGASGGGGALQPGVLPPQSQAGPLSGPASPLPQAATGQATAALAGQTGAQPSGQAMPPGPAAAAGTGAMPSGTAMPAPQTAGSTPSTQTGPQAGAQSGMSSAGQGAALATLTAGTGGLGQQPGAAPVRILSGQPYQQLGSQPLGTAPVANSGQQVAGNPGPAAQVAGALQQPLSEQQSGLASLFAQVGSLMSAQGAGNVTLPDTVVKAMQQILGLRLNVSGGASSGDFQQAVRQSGQFREAQLALPGSGTAGSPDLKSALLSFKSLLQQLGARPEIARPAGQPAAPSRHTPPQGQAPLQASGYWAGAAPQNLQALLKETDAALARLRLTQLSNTGLARDAGPQATAKPMDLVLELPLALGQETAVMQMQIGRDGAGNQNEDEGEPAWRLRFALDLTATGPLEAAISLRGGGTYASLWVDRKDTFESLNAVRETMEAAFADAGLDLQELRLIRGLPPRTAAYYGSAVDRKS